MFSDSIVCVDENRRCAHRLVQHIQNHCFRLAFSELLRQIGLSVNTIRNIAQDYLSYLEQSYPRPTPSILGIDEVMIAGEYRYVLTDLEHHRLFNILSTRKQSYLESYFEQLPNKESIHTVCSDMWQPFKMFVPNAYPLPTWFWIDFMLLNSPTKPWRALESPIKINWTPKDASN
ncbi:hypothetical protein MOVS_06425 [Moraxella ovis]|uniref:Transposase IS204/IS1001/IS1096/IS1165 DDE domain-containing protein n=1 Tax=Moraxella ovis TaxID=29433 RepID=A0ABM6BDZ5_9GAMM|nr:hypothetical protein MOVS_06425 [Moraxella ovis]